MYRKKKATILLVDDIPSNIVALEAVLASPNYELVTAMSGFEALRLCNQREFALIVLDIQMPGMDGFETARKIKESELNKEVPIIFVTAVFQEDPFIRKGFEAGAIDYFGKPFNPEILRAKVGIYTELFLKTKRLQETEELLRTHTQIKTFLEAMPVGVIIANRDGLIYEYNEEAKRLLSVSRETCIGDLERKAWWPDSGNEISPEEWSLDRALKEKRAIENERVLIETDSGPQKLILVSAYPIKNDSGAVIGAFSVIQDASAREQLAADIHKAVTILKEANDTQSRA